jgi:hypothetical protein
MVHALASRLGGVLTIQSRVGGGHPRRVLAARERRGRESAGTVAEVVKPTAFATAAIMAAPAVLTAL